MSGKFRTQKFGVRTGDKNVQTHTQKSVDKQMPTIHILDFVKKQIFYFGAIYDVESSQHFVQVTDR